MRDGPWRPLATEFDLDCNTFEFVDLATLMTRMRDAYEATIGVKGCDRKSTYLTRCAQTGYLAGKHELSCASTITSVDRSH